MGRSRRSFVFQSVGAVVLGAISTVSARAAEEPLELSWSDLMPTEGGTEIERLRSLGVVQHGEYSTPFDQVSGGSVTEEYNGQTVRIPGYLIGLDFDGIAVTAGLLVPYVGACIHVPPPPPNQLVFVTVDEPYESAGLFEPVWVTGVLGTTATETQLAEVGYGITAGRIEPYQ